MSAVRITGKVIGDKKLELLHEPSGTLLRSAAPVDNAGDGSSFSPTDLAAAALGSCVLTTIAIVAARDGVDLQGSHFSIEKHMTTTPRKIGALPLVVHLPATLEDSLRRKYEKVGQSCPVKRSLSPDVDAPITFLYDVS